MKDLKAEGITKEMLQAINMERDFSPVQLLPGEEPVKLIQCSQGYWVMLEFGDYLKDEKNRLVVIPEKEARIGRARYKINFADQINAHLNTILENQIQDEVKRLKNLVDNKLKEDLSKLREILILGGKLEPEGLEKILYDAIDNASGDDPYSINGNDKRVRDHRRKIAKEMATDSLLESYNLMLRLKEQEQYNSLYQHYFQDGLPQVASFNMNTDVAAAKKYFGANAIIGTIDDMQQQDHIYNVAKFNVEKRNLR